ncbi:MAG: DEAD/DEAH box helicase, partial [Deltaproteobacteria bacterium]
MVLSSFIEGIKKSEELGPQVVYHRYLPRQEPKYNSCRLISSRISRLLQDARIANLYTHQVEAIEKVKGGEDILVATPTASGKSLIYNIPVLEAMLDNPATRALYIFPLKALEQDQLKNLLDL